MLGPAFWPASRRRRRFRGRVLGADVLRVGTVLWALQMAARRARLWAMSVEA